MQVKYLGPADHVDVSPYGRHMKDKIKPYPDDFAEELLATSKRQRFEVVLEKGGSEEIKARAEILGAARKAVKDGNSTADGKPGVKAIEAILGRKISTKDRDEVWDQIQAEIEKGK